eukprot:6213259-Pyramimonas_sp.AAC.1
MTQLAVPLAADRGSPLHSLSTQRAEVVQGPGFQKPAHKAAEARICLRAPGGSPKTPWPQEPAARTS